MGFRFWKVVETFYYIPYTKNRSILPLLYSQKTTLVLRNFKAFDSEEEDIRRSTTLLLFRQKLGRNYALKGTDLRQIQRLICKIKLMSSIKSDSPTKTREKSPPPKESNNIVKACQQSQTFEILDALLHQHLLATGVIDFSL